MGAFWASVAMAEIDLPPPLTQGVVKGLLFRHLRYWASKPDIFYQDGTMNIGYLYPNMFMCENYNSPQSPYWSMKALVMMALPEDHSFWSCEEEPLPLESHSIAGKLQVTLLKYPKHILVDSGNHHFLLSSGQYAGWPLKATKAKYCKFAYSTSFGFSVPTGPVLDQLAPDSTLAISADDGESWRVRWRSEETIISSVTYKETSGHQGEKVPSLVNVWSPSKSSPLKITTTLIPPTDKWPDWHIRVHKVDFGTETPHAVSTVEGGFAIYGQKSGDGRPLHSLNWSSLPSATDDALSSEGVLQEGQSSIIVSKAGASGIRHILGPNINAGRGVVLKPDSNTNLMSSRTLIPTIQQKLFEGGEKQHREIVIATAVFAVNRSNLSTDEVKRRWCDCPQLQLEGSEEVLQGEFIEFSLD